jgi:succinate dehydrogenase / fumarate reductase membrane anchor subunit
MSKFETPARRVRGLGASGHGASHFISQRVSAIALFFLAPLFVGLLAFSGAPDYEASRAFFASPLGAIITLLTLTAALHHMRLGLQVVVEDYISEHGTKTALLLLNTFVTVGLWLTAVFFLLTLAL